MPGAATPTTLELPKNRADVLINLTEVCRLLGVTPAGMHTRRWKGLPTPPSMRRGGQVWMRSSDVRRWIVEGDRACASMTPF